MAKRPCSRPGCKNLVERGGCCAACAPTHSARARTEAARPSAHKRGYTRKWAEYSRNRLRLHPLCVDPYQQHPQRVAAATDTDHIVPVQGPDDPLFWDPSNHQSLCSDCHKHKTAKYDGAFGRTSNAHPTRGGRVQISQGLPPADRR